MSKHAKGSATPSASTFPPGSDPLAVVPAAVTGIVPALLSINAAPATFDVALAESYESAYAARLTAIAPDRIRILRLDPDAVCGAALTVHALIHASPLLARYKAFAEFGDFVLTNLDDLKALAFIVLDARRRANAAGAFVTNAKVPPALDKESATVEERMMKISEHYFWEDPDLGPVVQALHPGTSYLDRAYDLLGYADIYEQQHAIVSADKVHYRSSDLADARRLAGEILAALGAAMSPQARTWYDLTQRAWTLLEAVYNEVRELGLVFLRSDPLREKRFPSLYVVGRPSTGRRKTKKDEGSAKPEGGAAAGEASAKDGEEGAKDGAAKPAEEGKPAEKKTTAGN